MIQSILINFHPNKHNQELRYYLFAVNLDRCAAGSWNILADLYNRACVMFETEYSKRCMSLI